MKGKRYGGLFSMLSATILAAGLMVGSGFTPAQAAGPGPEVCANCHADAVKGYQATKHSTKTDKRTPANAGACSTCHGDGTAHVKAGGGKGAGGIINPGSKTLAAEDKNKTCLACHQADPRRIHWQASVHAGRDVACTSCHKLHSRDDVREKLTQPQVCFACHKEQRVQVNKPSRHPILEGKVSCADCHNVHSNNPKQMERGSVVETCYQCHMEKRGPFVHNHQPVTEDCTICHQPHGTTIANLLKSRPPFLCQDCHSLQGGGHPTQFAGVPTGPAPGTGQAGTVGRGCLNCHTNIHGSNSTQNSATAGRFRR
ncbi:MAG: DmsE family decaheme c-type cytochrome [Burkholderiales bacterium]|nr:DmsE family decaheme c-type cytochrome [Burkholderiales bacterium]